MNWVEQANLNTILEEIDLEMAEKQKCNLWRNLLFRLPEYLCAAILGLKWINHSQNIYSTKLTNIIRHLFHQMDLNFSLKSQVEVEWYFLYYLHAVWKTSLPQWIIKTHVYTVSVVLSQMYGHFWHLTDFSQNAWATA